MSIKHRLWKANSNATSKNILSALLLMILITGAVIGVSGWSKSSGKPSRGSVLSGRAPSGAQTETVSVVLGASTFSPAAVTRAAGPFRLEVTNQSGGQSFTLQLRRDNGGDLVHEWTVQIGAGQMWSQTIDLPQGGYNLRLAENPACLFHITMQ